MRRRSSLFLQEYIQAKGHGLLLWKRAEPSKRSDLADFRDDVRKMSSVSCDSHCTSVLAVSVSPEAVVQTPAVTLALSTRPLPNGPR